MKISKEEVLALIEGIEADDPEDRASASLRLRDLKARATAPDGPFHLKKDRDHRYSKGWRVEADDWRLDLPEEFERFYYEKTEAQSAVARLNLLHESGERERMVLQETQRLQHLRAMRTGWEKARDRAKPLPTMTPEDVAEEDDLARKVTGQ